MNSFGRVAATFVVVLMSAACASKEYRPLAEGEAVRIHVNGYSHRPLIRNGVEYRGAADGYIQNQDYGSAFGIRVNDEGEYLSDEFVVDNGLEEKTLRCILWGDKDPTDDLVRSWCSVPFMQAEPGRAVHVRFNDFDGSVIVMPELAPLTLPEENSEFSVSSGEALVLSWEPLSKGDSMTWLLANIGEDEPGSCANTLSWTSADGSMEDTGSLVIPNDELPTDLPAEGCPVVLEFSRGRVGTLDPGIKLGSIFGYQNYKVQMTLKP